MLQQFVEFIVNIADKMGYLGIVIMMTLESCFIPFPSEVAMIPAGYLSSVGKMNFLLAFLAGTFGVFLGSNINYFLGKFLGRTIIIGLINKFGKYFFIKVKDYEKTEIFFQKHGSITTFVGRLIPVIRQLISIPAGVFKMNYIKFVFFTVLGGGMWNLILMVIGYIAGENKELIYEYSHEVLIFTFIFIALLITIYIILNNKKSKK